MTKFIRLIIIVIILCAQESIYSQNRNENIIAEWNFDSIVSGQVKESVSGILDSISGHFDILDGVVGKAIKCDGFTTSIFRDGDDAPLIIGPFTIQAWVAPQAYPWNWCAVYNQEYNHQRGIFFGIDGEGRVGLHAAIARQWRECISDAKIPFMEWSHIAATFDPEIGINLYINAELVGELRIKGDLLNDREMDLQIARNHKLTVPSSLNRAGFVRIPASYSFDGIIDELKIIGETLSQSKIKTYYQQTKTDSKPSLNWRKLPGIQTEKSEFGAFYTKLNYDPDWDRIWRDDKYPDIVVTFPNKKYSMVFWKGTNYNMNLVTENGKWIADQSAETFGALGCMEHMSDKQNRYSHVRLIENNTTRVVVHWRYALTDILYQIADTDPVTNWGVWADEYYIIYPDGIAVRHFTVHGNGEVEFSITEPALISNPGDKPEDNIESNAVTLANLKGETSDHSYENWPGDGEGGFIGSVSEPVISVINLKSNSKPFYIYEKGTSIGPYGGGIREIDYRYSNYHSRNHWPVTQIPCDGRFVLASDRVTSSAITSPEPRLNYRKTDNSVEGRFLMGISDKPVKDLIPFAKFWLSPPQIIFNNNDNLQIKFNKNERAYIINGLNKEKDEMELHILANPDSPLVNPVFIIKDWGDYDLELDINSNPVPMEVYKYSLKRNLDSKDLIIWLDINENSTTDLNIKRKNKY